MNKKNKKIDNYIIGLDIGVGSVGWAVINENYELLKNGNQKHLWGYDIFDKAETAKERRVYRGTRRRLSRKKIRIKLLQDLTQDMIAGVDPLFFKKLKYSYLVDEDKSKKAIYTNGNVLFDDSYTDKQFYKEYPTIYHLRKKLIESKEKVDPRLIYLAMHHIVKYRGNFKQEGQDISKNNSVNETKEALQTIFDHINEINDTNISTEKIDDIITIIYNEKLHRVEKTEEIQKLAEQSEDKKMIKLISDSIFGLKFDPCKLFAINETVDKISFADSDYNEKIEELADVLGEEIEYLDLIKTIYESYVLSKIMPAGVENISEAMKFKYDKYHEDLALLKIVKKRNPKIKEILAKDNEYDNYVNKKKGKLAGKSVDTIEILYKKITEAIKEEDGDEEKQILKDIANKEFLIKINITDNSEIPYQLHLKEIEKIIDNQKEYYPCLKENKDKICSLVSFRIPYYVGPFDTNKENNKFAWIIRKDNSNEPIRPWNFDEIVDKDATAKEFINRMRNHCSYLLEEETLPKESILLNRFNLYNELNKVRYNDEFFNVDTKEKIIHDLFENKNEVKEDDLRKWIINNQLPLSNKGITISGLQKDKKFSSSLKTENKFKKILGSDYDEKKVETIIEYLTVYNDKKIIRRRLLQEKLCNEEQLEKIIKIKCSGYGRLSRKLINGIPSTDINSNPGTILDHMKNSNQNFMQVLYDKDYGYIEKINELNKIEETTLNYSEIENLACSPALKRGIWQSIRVTKDIVKYMGKEPSDIFIEVARQSEEKKRTESRYDKLKKLYDDAHIKDEILRKYKDKEIDDKLYLYFLQEGKCLYSEEPLEIKELEKYEIDHIIAQTYKKDDSLENKALVKTKENQRKSDNLVLEEEIVKKHYAWWTKLHDNKMMGDKKFQNLIRKDFSPNEKENFINRDLVETRQICVHVRDLLKGYYKDTNVNTVHANLITEYRKKYKLYKIRNLNNLHHAHDAYLIAMIGKFISTDIKIGSTEYINNLIKDRINDEKRKISLDSPTIYLFNKSVRCNEDTGEIIWSGSEHCNYCRKIFAYSDCFYNYKTHVEDGKLYNATKYPATKAKKKGDAEAKIRIKADMSVEDYGGYDSLETSYIACYSYLDKGKIKKAFIKIPVLNMNDDVKEYIKATKNVDVIDITPINIGQTFKYDNSLYCIVSESEIKTIQPIIIDSKNLKTLHVISHLDNCDSIPKKEEDKKPIKEKIEHRLDKESISEQDVNMLINELVYKIHKYIPEYRKYFISMFDIKEGDDKNEFERKVNLQLNELNVYEKAVLVNNLMSPLSKGQRKDIKINVKITKPAYGRLTISIDANKVELIHTSPSGLFNRTTKL
jgi:CRISPR-associated endonuclease Csn1